MWGTWVPRVILNSFRSIIVAHSKILNKNLPENGGHGWKGANNTLMAYVCDDCPSQPTSSIITASPCALNWLNVLCSWKDSRWRWNCWENWSLPLEQFGFVIPESVISCLFHNSRAPTAFRVWNLLLVLTVFIFNYFCHLLYSLQLYYSCRLPPSPFPPTPYLWNWHNTIYSL